MAGAHKRAQDNRDGGLIFFAVFLAVGVPWVRLFK